MLLLRRVELLKLCNIADIMVAILLLNSRTKDFIFCYVILLEILPKVIMNLN